MELLILYEIWAGERRELEKAVPGYRSPGRSISVSAVPFGPDTDIWRSCRFSWCIVSAAAYWGGSGVVMVLLPGPVSPRALLAGDLPLRYCSARFACKIPTWRLPDRGHVCELVTDRVDCDDLSCFVASLCWSCWWFS